MWHGLIKNVIVRHSREIALIWTILAIGLTLQAPSLSGQIRARPVGLLPEDTESRRARDLADACWPDQAAESLVVLGLDRAGGLTAGDREFTCRFTARIAAAGDRPAAILGVDGPDSMPELAEQLVGRDGTIQLVVVRLSESFVSPDAEAAVSWLEARLAETARPEGLRVIWSGDAVLGTRFMSDIRTTLDRAAWATVLLILLVLLLVYRSLWLALVPLLTIGLSLACARGVLGWLVQAGFEASILVELFLIVILFGCGTDFCLLLSWRFVEIWDGADPAEAMARTVKRVAEPLLTSAGTVIIGLSLMGTTHFKLFSSTGPNVAIGLAVTVVACLTLTPALLVLLARVHPRAFAGLRAHSSTSWASIGRRVLTRPVWVGATVLIAMGVPAVMGLTSRSGYDLLADLPAGSEPVRDFRRLAAAFGPGVVAPLTIMLESDQDLRQSRPLAMIDEISRSLADRRDIASVRSATQPTGDPTLVDRARIGRRLGEIAGGLDRLSRGSDALNRRFVAEQAVLKGVDEKKRKAAEWFRGLARAPAQPAASRPDPPNPMIAKLDQAIAASGEIACGAKQARDALATIRDDPAGRAVLDRLLLTPHDVAKNPRLQQGFAYYVSPDGHRARIDLAQKDPVFSAEAIEGVEGVRRQLGDRLEAIAWGRVRAGVGGMNALWTDIRSQTQADQWRIWWAVPLAVAVILWVALRDIAACLNLIATMILTYLFALGVTHLVFVTGLGAPGIDWKVPYFLFILLVVVGVDYNVFLMARLREESRLHGLHEGIVRAIGRTGGLISSAAAITACSFAAFLFSPLGSLQQLGFALVVGIIVDAVLVRPILVPCGHWLLHRRKAEGNDALPRRGRTEVLPISERDFRQRSPAEMTT